MDSYKTPDLYFAAYLKVAGAPYKGSERVGKRLFFVFDVGVVDIEGLKKSWFSGEGKVPGLPFTNEIKNFKTICHME